jgi:hypothetical protein
MVARLTAGWALLGDGRLAQAEEEIERGLALSRSLGASRFEPFLMESQARISWLQGRRSQAREQITRAADAVGRQQLQRFIGPWVYGTLALLSDDAVLRRQALAQGNASLSKDCVAHNAFRFLVAAAEAALLDGDVAAAVGYAGRLMRHTELESCAWIEHHVALVRQFAQYSQDGNSEALTDLRAQGLAFGFAYAAPRLHNLLEAL